MKRNLMTVIILILLVLNLILTAIVTFSTVSANKKTIALVNSIASVLDIEISGASAGEEEEAEVISVEDSEIYDIADAMTIALKPSADGSDHYAMVEVSFSVNTKHDDYKTYQPMLSAKESKIKSEIIDVVGSYTKEEAVADIDGLKAAILKRIQAMFDSDFVYEAYFRDIKFQ